MHSDLRKNKTKVFGTMLSKSFKAAKCKTSLKLAVARIKLLKNKRQVQLKQLKKEVAQLLESGQEQTARIRVEHVVREEKTMAAYDIVELYCELIVVRLPIIESQKNCPIDLKEPIASVIFASPRCADIPELSDVCKHFTKKYGKEFITAALELRPDSGVNHTIIEKLSAKTPDGETKIKILTAIAQEHNVKWDPAALEEQVLKPNEDLLNGPSKFVSASKMHVESPNIQVPPSTSQKCEPATKSSENDVNRSAQNSKPISATMGAPVSMPRFSTPDLGASGGATEGEEFRHSLSKNETYLNKRNWNMEFKDATSAAQAAAESAEMASMAARAAAELARRGNVTGEYSTESHSSYFHGSIHEGRGRSTEREFEDEHAEDDSARVEKESQRRSHVMKQRIQNEERDEAGQDLLSRAAESRCDYGNANISSSKPVSFHSKGPSIDDNMELANLQKMDDFSSKSSPSVKATNQNWQGRSCEKDNFILESSKKKSGRQSSTNSSMSSLDDEIVVDQKTDGVSHKSFTEVKFFNKNQCSTNVEMDDHRAVHIGGQSSNSAISNSHTSPIGNDAMWDLNAQSSDEDLDRFSSNTRQVNTKSGSEKPSLSDYFQVVYDESGSDCDTHLELERDNNRQHFDSYFPLEGASSSSHLSSTIEPLRSKQWRSEFFLENNSSKFVESSEETAKATLPSQSDELLTPTFDESDGMNSESEVEGDHFNLRERMKTSSSPSNQNVSTRSLSSSISGHGPTESHSSKRRDAEIKKQNARSCNSDDSDLVDIPSESYQEAKLNVVGESGKRCDPLSSQPSPRHIRSPNESSDLTQKSSYNAKFEDQLLLWSSRLPSEKEVPDKDKFDGRSLPLGSKDSEFSKNLSIENEKELKFGRLTGGLRNKGYSQPPHVRGHSAKITSSSSEQTADEMPTVAAKPIVLPLDKILKSSETCDDELQSQKTHAKVHKESRSNIMNYFDLDSDDVEVQPPRTVGSRGHHGIVLSRRTRDSPTQSVMSSPLRFGGRSEVPVSSDSGLESGLAKPSALRSLSKPANKTEISEEMDNVKSTLPNSTNSEAHESMLNDQKLRANAHKELISTPESDSDSDSDGSEVVLPHQTFRGRGYQDAMLSRRTRDSLYQLEMESPQSVSGRSEMPVGSDFGAGSKFSKPSSSVAETTKPSTETVISSTRRPSKFLPPNEITLNKECIQYSQPNSVSEQPSKPLSRTLLSGHDERQKSLSSAEERTSSENSLKSGSHVHPKLPDYEKVAAHLESLRLNRRSQ